ncbi:hypothetical protein HYFRA_00003672 [Hymenoscyphus fraxineus]|uniref:DUF1857-domain-containing protein n=1 Tax=Hymenoscyphus fraxineus TaxID=746836 RepID=A0A9N9L3E8_9HELO|nr:hypothetical protein HYFRA_00003672 [Hymenoscyphus fraxineus]
MSSQSTNTAFTAPINPTGQTPLTLPQIWSALRLKIRSAETFVPGGISSTTVLSSSISPETKNEVTVREVIFTGEVTAGQKKATETVTLFEGSRVEFVQPNGSKVQNIVSEGEDGQLYMTYVFEWMHPGASEEERKEFAEKEKKGARMAVLGTIDVMRKLAGDGKL